MATLAQENPPFLTSLCSGELPGNNKEDLTKSARTVRLSGKRFELAHFFFFTIIGDTIINRVSVTR